MRSKLDQAELGGTRGRVVARRVGGEVWGGGGQDVLVRQVASKGGMDVGGKDRARDDARIEP